MIVIILIFYHFHITPFSATITPPLLSFLEIPVQAAIGRITQKTECFRNTWDNKNVGWKSADLNSFWKIINNKSLYSLFTSGGDFYSWKSKTKYKICEKLESHLGICFSLFGECLILWEKEAFNIKHFLHLSPSKLNESSNCTILPFYSVDLIRQCTITWCT